MNQINVLFVCLGNICRSPMAEGIFKKVIEREGLQKQFNINSAGTARYHIGKNPDNRAIRVCAQNDIVLQHKGQQVLPIDLEKQDYILAMDGSNFQDIESLVSVGKKKAAVFLMRDFDLENKGADVPDPYYGGEEGFYEVFGMLERSSYELLRYIRMEHSI
jgi:protein-tyrosine phosphatase